MCVVTGVQKALDNLWEMCWKVRQELWMELAHIEHLSLVGAGGAKGLNLG